MFKTKRRSKRCTKGRTKRHTKSKRRILKTWKQRGGDILNDFMIVCQNGNLDMAKQILQANPTLDISANNEMVFRWACNEGQLEVAQWLLQVKPTIDISIQNEWAFRMACENGHLEVAQWLLQVKPTINKSLCGNTEIRNHLKFQEKKLPLLAASEFGRDKTKSGKLSKLNADVARHITEYIN